MDMIAQEIIQNQNQNAPAFGSVSKGVTLVYLNTVIRWTCFKAAKPSRYK